MCTNVEVKRIYLPPYCPHLNPIKEKFSQVKTIIRREFPKFKKKSENLFQLFLENYIRTISRDVESAKGYFKYTGVIVIKFNLVLVI